MHQRKGRNNNGTNESSTNTNNNTNTNSMYNRVAGSDLEGGRGRNGGLSAGDANASILEQQNNERINELADHVARLKGLTIDIGNEVREQNSLLDNMGDGFQNTRDMLQGSLRRIGSMLEQGGAKHMCYMVAFCVFIMVFLWWLMSSKG